MKIVGFTQLHEELRKGHLAHWMRSMERVCDLIYIWDQNSQDGSREFYVDHPKCVVVEHHTNDFYQELLCKRELLNKLLAEQPDVDWIFWMDGDTVLEEAAHDGIRDFLSGCPDDNVLTGHLNLWRGNTHHRVDSDFDSMKGGRPVLWRVAGRRGELRFLKKKGLHHEQYPRGKTTVMSPWVQLHLGFASDYILYDRMRVDPDRSHWARHLTKPTLVEVPAGMLPPYIPVVPSCHDPLPPPPEPEDA